MEGREIQYSDSTRYLGVELDRKLDWKKHIEGKIKNAKKLLHVVANISRDSYGPKPKMMKWAFESIVRSKLMYGSMVWGHMARKYEGQLRRLNRMAINTITHIPKSAPTRGLEVVLDIMPLHLAIEENGLAAFVRLNRGSRLG
jgi:hypothetical protein